MYNASNEECVNLFLQDKIKYTDIFEIMEKCTEYFKNGNNSNPTIEDIILADKESKEFCKKLI